MAKDKTPAAEPETEAQVIATDALPEVDAAVSTKATDEIKVHENRGHGGRYVSIGGGERVWVDEGQGEDGRPQDDAAVRTD